MKKFAKRSHERRAFNFPITHSMYNWKNHHKHFPTGYSDNYHMGVMGNISEGGMYFESGTPCRKNSLVYINVPGDSSGLMVSHETETLSGTVVWCMENMNKGLPVFRIGVKFEK